jgi:Tfp pilus assembly protein PilF/peroxiredoxin
MLLQGRSLSGHERNCCFLNTLASEAAGERFATISAVSGLDFDDDGQAAAQVDWDHDGDVDLVLSNRNAPRVRFMRNENPAGNRFVQFCLTGNGTDTNRNAIGARVTITLQTTGDEPPVKLLKTLRAGDGFLTQSAKCLHFGLGEDASIRQVEVRWPNREGQTEVFEALPVNQRYEIVQGRGEARPLDLNRENLAIQPRPTEVPTPDVTMRIPLLHQFLAPQLSYVDYDGQTRPFPLPPDQMVLVNLWSTTCAPCVRELTEFGSRYDELQQAGVQVLALNIDELQAMPEARREARQMAERLGFPFPSGMAPAEVISELQRLHNSLIRINRALPMPSSFLIDRAGRLNVIYKGTVEVDQLVQDGQPQDLDLLERFARSAAFAGTILEDPLVNGPMEQNEAAAMIRLGKQYIKERELDKAERVFLDALRQVPDSAAVHNQLAVVYKLQRKPDLAIRHYKDAVALDPDKPGLRINLAQMLIRNQQYDEAALHLDHALTHAPEHADAHYNRGLVYSAQRDIDNEMACYQRALEIRPDHAQSLFRLGRIYEARRDLETATAYYERAARQAPGAAEVLTALARVLISGGELPRAEQLLQEAMASNPRFPDACFQLGRVYLASGRLPEARQQFVNTLQLNPGHRGAMGALQQLQQVPGSGGR